MKKKIYMANNIGELLEYLKEACQYAKKLEESMNKINNWESDIDNKNTQEKKDKIDVLNKFMKDKDDLEAILNKYMWGFDERFLVEWQGETIKLFFTDDEDKNGIDYLLITYKLNERLFEFENLKLRETKFLEATQYYYHFIKKVKELF